MRRRSDIALALLVVAALGMYVAEKSENGRWGELLFGCHIASALVAVGVLSGAKRLVAIGFVFHAAVGIPSWLVWTFFHGTRPLEIAGHVVPMCAALPVIAREGWPRGVSSWAWAMFVIAQQASLWLTDPALNVNVAHAPTPELARFVSSPAMARAVVCAAALTTLFLAELALRRTLRSRTS